MSAQFAYDAVAYPSVPLPQAHPDRLFVVGSLFGLSPKPAEACRYLEVGCGTGAHLIAAAVALPGTRFVGLDLSLTAIEDGRREIAALGLGNVELHHADLTAWEPGPDRFDYVAAHGVYSWVPAPVRDALLALCGTMLVPDGMAYVSYNTYPGCHIRQMLWEMTRFHTRTATDPISKLAAAREFLGFLAKAQAGADDPAARLVAAGADRAADPSKAFLLYHDDLSEVNDPVYLVDFVRHAQAHGLRYVSEADLSDTQPTGCPPDVIAVLAGLAEQDPLLREQYFDFVKLRSFRRTLLCRADRTPTPTPSVTRVTGLSASTTARRVADPTPSATGFAFRTPDGRQGRVDRPLAAAVLAHLCESTPDRVPFDRLHQAAEAASGSPGGRPDAVAGVLLDGYLTGLIELHGFRPAVARSPREQPTASPLARRQAAVGDRVTTLYHTTVQLDDTIRRLVQLLDGTRTRAALAAELAGVVPAKLLAAEIEQALAWLAKQGVLVGPDVTPPGA